MSFVSVKPWQRHVATLRVDATQGSGSVRTVCARCGLELPLVAPLNSVVLTKEDRCYLGDNVKAVNCEL